MKRYFQSIKKWWPKRIFLNSLLRFGRIIFWNLNLDQEIALILKGVPYPSTIINIASVLNGQPSDFQRAFDVALEMQNRNLIKLLYSNYNTNQVMVEFTLLAKS